MGLFGVKRSIEKLYLKNTMSPGERSWPTQMPTKSLLHRTEVLSSLPAHLEFICFSPGHFVLCRRGQEEMCARPHGLTTKR